MVIGSNFPLEIGSIHTGLVGGGLQIHTRQAYVVVRQSTYEEWRKQYIEAGEDTKKIQPFTSLCYFYEIQTD